jgi:hypothetical protein
LSKRIIIEEALYAAYSNDQPLQHASGDLPPPRLPPPDFSSFLLTSVSAISFPLVVVFR